MRPETQALHLYAIEYTRRETESGTKTHPWPLSRGEVLRMRETGHAASQKSNTNWIKFCHEHNGCAPTMRLNILLQYIYKAFASTRPVYFTMPIDF